MQKFNFHSHTYRCGHADFDYTDEEYVQDYIKNGFTKIAFTDHAPEKQIIDKRSHMRMGYEQRHEYYSSIRKLKEKYADKIEIQTGFEIEFLPDQVDNILELKNEIDKLILGQHFVYDDNEDLYVFWSRKDYKDFLIIRYGEYIENAMELGIPDIIAHPDVYCLNSDKFTETDEITARRICKAAEKYQIPLEINLNGVSLETYFKDRTLNNDAFEEQVKRLKNVRYPNENFWKIASEYNVKVLYGLDTHHRNYIELFPKLVELANIKIGADVISKLNFVEDIK